MRSLLALWPTGLALVACAVACGDNEVPEDPGFAEICDPAPGDGVSFDPEAEPCLDLASYRFFLDGSVQVPNEGVIPYDLNTPLFSDYASKHRFLWIPPDTAIGYTEDGPFEFPDGSVLIKTFGFAHDRRDPGAGERLIETRLLVRRGGTWEGLVYRWNPEQSEARLAVAGGIVPVSWIDTDGADRQLDYIVPNINQCDGCHTSGEAVELLGPRARHLNRDLDYGDGPENQLVHLAGLGMLAGAPADPAAAPRAPVFDDPATGTVEERARAWLDINCAHCHNAVGPARTSGLDLSIDQSNPVQFGVCKTPVAAGAGSGGLQYNIVPGQPDESILVFRLEATRPDIRMPEILRQTVHTESAALVREWIAGLEGSCEAPE
jgi:uncharacterized repeat protein (TIGR03806 family)